MPVQLLVWPYLSRLYCLLGQDTQQTVTFSVLKATCLELNLVCTDHILKVSTKVHTNVFISIYTHIIHKHTSYMRMYPSTASMNKAMSQLTIKEALL